MKKWIFRLILLCFLVIPVSAMEFTAPTVPGSAEQYMPSENETFAQGLWYIIKTAVASVHPEFANAAGTGIYIISATLLLSILNTVSKSVLNSIRLTGAIILGVILLEPVNSFINLGSSTVAQLSEYGKLILPVMTASLAAQGGTTSSAALYAGTVLFDSILITLINNVIVPMLYVYLCFSVAGCAIEQEILKKIRDFIKWLMTWSMKWILYIFTGYIGITGVISGVVDASALKATKIAISGMVPVIGGILSDTSEAILVSAGVMKSTAGIYGIFALTALFISPFLKIGLQYLLLKFTSAVCSICGVKSFVDLIRDFSSGMGFILAMTGTVCILQLISLVCFMKGIS